MGLSGISRSTVSKLCKDIEERVHALLDRPLPGDWPSARNGTSITAGDPMRAVLETLGIKDVLAKSLASRDPHNMVKPC